MGRKTFEAVRDISNPNLLINGNFDIWQRGTSFTASGIYTADRWEWFLGTASAVSRIANTQTNIYTQYSLRFSNPTGIYLQQKIENQNNILYNRKSTISFWINSSQDVELNPQLWNATTGQNIQIVNINSGTGWQKKTVTFDASTAWSDGDVIELRVLRNVTVVGVLDITQVKFEVGDTATEFIPKTEAEELRDCQYYYTRFDTENTNGMYPVWLIANSTTNARGPLQLPRKMRLNSPTLITSSGTFRLLSGDTSANITSLTIDTSANTTQTLRFSATVASGLTINRMYNLQSLSDTDAFIAFDAEL